MSNSRHSFCTTMLLLIGLGLCGCGLPAQLAWSPDGSQAAYRVGTEAFVIGQDGTVIQKLGPSLGGFAWSVDGKRLYYGAALDAKAQPGPELSPVNRKFFQGPVPPSKLSRAADVSAIRVLEAGEPRNICSLRGHVLHAIVSPDESWLAVSVLINPEGPEGEHPEGDEDRENDAGRIGNGWSDLYAISLRTGSVYLLAHPAGLGIAFTGPNRLAYVEREPGRWETSQLTNQLVEVTLDEASRRAPRTRPLANRNVPVWLRAQGEDLWLLEMPILPMSKDPLTLYRFHRANGKVSVIADQLSSSLAVLAVSPDGQRLVTVRQHPPGETDELVVMNADGSEVRTVRLDGSWGPLFPSWRDNRHLLLASIDPVAENDKRKMFAIEEYEMDADNQVTRVRTITDRWPREMLPYVQEPLSGKVVPAPAQESNTR